MSTSSILIIEDEKTLASNIRRYLEKFDYDVQVSECGNEALNQLVVATPDLVLLDLKLPDMSGLDILPRIRKFEPNIKVIMMTAFGDVETAVTAMKEGASDFLTKPLKLAKLRELLERVLMQPVDGAREPTSDDREDYFFEELVGEDRSIVLVKQKIVQLLKSESRIPSDPPPVLVTGPTGTGKELVARALHFQGPRAQAPFLNLSGSMLTPELLDRCNSIIEANQSAIQERNILSTVSGGTLFLDEIADVSLDVQAKLIDLIADRDPISSARSTTHEPDIRIIASTSRSLKALVQSGQFRSDLYFRLHVINIDLPPLCDRGGDISLLAEHFLSIFAQRYGKSPIRFDDSARISLMNYKWPGNVRELRNLIEQAVLTADGPAIFDKHLNLAVLPANESDPGPNPDQNTTRFGNAASTPENRETSEKQNLVAALDRAGWNVSLAARILGVSRDTVRYRIKKHELTRPKIW